MDKQQLTQLFDQQAPNYDTQWRRMSPINNGLYFFMETILGVLPTRAHILCVGAGTGKEMLHLAKHFPEWCFTAVEPSGEMLNQCRKAVELAGFTSRCDFYQGYVEALPSEEKFDGATSLLVSQFILDQQARSEFFRHIANRLKPEGLLVSADLVADTRSEIYEGQLNLWLRLMANAAVSQEDIQRMKAAYSQDVAVLPTDTVATIIKAGGFTTPIPFYQAGLIGAFFAHVA
ncbi:class I SAM-dependent methyltransferase [Hahella sp. NBU794]|uniref:class I SAM-dependent methyltransferase n=1 Tax=Hahella sp. NBU794 TaxID=3422590 RepID=UPI003D6F7F1D